MMKDTNPKDAVGVRKWRQFMTVPRQVLWEVGVAMLEGALKYGRHNYRASGVRASVYCDAALGHIEQFIEGEDIDEDSGLSHVTKAIASLVVLRDAMMNDFWEDDRPPKIRDMQELRERLSRIVDENFERYADKNPHHYCQLTDGAPYHAAGAVGRHNTAVRTQLLLDARGDGPANYGLTDTQYELLAQWYEQDEAPLTNDAQEAMLILRKWAISNRYWNVGGRVDVTVHSVLGERGPEAIVPHRKRVAAVDVPYDIPPGTLLVTPDMRVGKTYRAMKNAQGLPIVDGGVWTVIRMEDGEVFGVKSEWDDDHPGVTLANSYQWVEVVEDER